MRPRSTALPVLTLLALAASAGSLAGPAAADTWRITLDPAARAEPATGRVILFFVTGSGPRWNRVAPSRAPFLSSPQPIASIAVRDLAPGATVEIDGSAWAFPAPLDALDGPVRVQAVLDAAGLERNWLDEPGNVLSATRVLEPDAGDDGEVFELVLDRPIEPPAPLEDGPNLRWVEFESPSLSAAAGRPVVHRAGVALPPGFAGPPPGAAGWPAVYVVPGFGGRHEGARSIAARLARRDPGLAPAVWIVLDPESPLGHHGFVDSPNHGPRGTALVTELIPHLEARFGLAARREARLLTGHSSGGWSTVWLQLTHPEVFGGCWSTAPDPVTFSAMQRIDVYADENAHVGPDGRPVPSFRTRGAGGRMEVRLTVREETRMEHAIDPTGRSGQQWDAWEAMFGPADPVTGAPRPLFDAVTGAIDHSVAEHWRRFDVLAILERRWDDLGPVVLDRVRIACGDLDSFYLDGAVERLAAFVERRAGGARGRGWIEVLPGHDHGSIVGAVGPRIAREMTEHLHRSGLLP